MLIIHHHAGHKYLYTLCWVLHGDISIDNIFISAPLSHDPRKDSITGHLVDFDCSKAARRARDLYKPPVCEVPPQTGKIESGLMSSLDDEFTKMFYNRLLEDIDAPDKWVMGLPFKILEYLYNDETGELNIDWVKRWKSSVTSSCCFPNPTHL